MKRAWSRTRLWPSSSILSATLIVALIVAFHQSYIRLPPVTTMSETMTMQNAGATRSLISRAEFEKVFPTIADDMINELLDYGPPEYLIKWFRHVSDLRGTETSATRLTRRSL